MSNKPKIAKRTRRVRLKQIPKPCKLGFTYHIGDTAGCGHIRCIFPSMILNNLMSKELKVEAFYTNKYTPMPQAYAQTTFAVFQRSATLDQLKMIQHLKSIRKNTSIIYEIDDNLFDIPDWNFAKDFYIKHVDTAKQILGEVDGIVTSTEFLRKEYSKYNKNIVVTPNHLPKFIWGDAEWKPQDNPKPRIMYAGSMNHFGLSKESDDGDFTTELIDFILATVDKYEWHFVGGIPQRIRDAYQTDKRIRYTGWQNVLELPHTLRGLNVDIALAPLEDNRFNWSKSNIKAMESTVLGLPVVCSNIGPYEGLPGAVNTTGEMIDRIEELAGDVDKRYQQWYDMHEALEPILFWEDNDNLLKYVNSFLRLVKMKL